MGLVVLWVVFAFIGWAIGSGKGRGFEGLLLGALLGPIGWIITGTLSRTPEAQARYEAQVSEARTQLEP